MNYSLNSALLYLPSPVPSLCRQNLTQKTMFNISAVQPGQRVTVRYSSPVTWARKTGNPYVDLDVTRKKTVAFTACGEETYSNMADRLGHETSGKPTWHMPAPAVGPCVRQHRGNGELYVAGINHDTVSSQFLIGGRPVTEEEERDIRTFLRESQERERGLDFCVWTCAKLNNATVS